jgi:hypothetical protein
MKMMLGICSDTAQRVEAQIAFQMLVNVIQHPQHSSLVVLERRLQCAVLPGDGYLTLTTAGRSADLAVCLGQSKSSATAWGPAQ